MAKRSGSQHVHIHVDGEDVGRYVVLSVIILFLRGRFGVGLGCATRYSATASRSYSLTVRLLLLLFMRGDSLATWRCALLLLSLLLLYIVSHLLGGVEDLFEGLLDGSAWHICGFAGRKAWLRARLSRRLLLRHVLT